MKKTTLHTIYCLSFIFIWISTSLHAQEDRVLVFTKTNGFAHQSIDDGVAMINRLGEENGLWTTEDTDDASIFTAENLASYRAIIWCNTSGDGLLNDDQKAAFEEYIANGGGFVGIHAATDTYRDGSWPFYNELVGGIVQTNPNHTAADYEATLTVINDHPSVAFLQGGYTKVEEYYYWERNGGYLYPENINLLEVEATGDESYDEARPISWYKEYMGGRSFYTALGHNESDYTDDENFIRHVEEGIKYVMGITLSINHPIEQNELKVSPNPVTDALQITTEATINLIEVYDMQGRRVVGERPDLTTLSNYTLDTTAWSPGIYLLKATGANSEQTVKIIKQ